MQSDAERQEKRSLLKDAISRNDAASAVEQARALIAASGKPADAMFCASALAQISGSIIEQLGARPLRLYIVRTVTVEPILPFLTLEAIFSNYVLDLGVGGYGSYADEMMNPESALAKFKPELVLVLLDLEDIAGRLPELCADGIGADVEAEIDGVARRMEHLLRTFRAGSVAKLLLEGLVVADVTSLGDIGDANMVNSLPRAVARLNQRLADVCAGISDCVFFDVDHLAARHGRSSWRDTRLFLSSRLAVSSAAFSVYVRGLVRSFSALFRSPRKILCTDLDNTLWGGVLGEDGVDGIQTGSVFPGNCYLLYQKYLKQLSSRGVLLAVVSKNNEAEVREAFQTRSADLALTLDDFAATKISWNEKSDSLRQLSQELSLGLDSFVLVDDNPVECEAVRKQLPQVAVVLASSQEPWRLVDVLSEQSFFDAAVVTEDDVNRLSDYKAQAARAEFSVHAGGRDEFLASLGIECTFLDATQAPLARAVQLLAKTNQFNLTTRRHSAATIEDFSVCRGGQAVVVRVRDRFGDAGVVGLALARTLDGVCRIDSFLLSCRVIGRGIESALLAHLAQRAARDDARLLVGEYAATKKNAPCADFFFRHGFQPSTSGPQPKNGSTFYELDVTAGIPESPKWIVLKGSELNECSANTLVSA